MIKKKKKKTSSYKCTCYTFQLLFFLLFSNLALALGHWCSSSKARVGADIFFFRARNVKPGNHESPFSLAASFLFFTCSYRLCSRFSSDSYWNVPLFSPNGSFMAEPFRCS